MRRDRLVHVKVEARTGMVYNRVYVRLFTTRNSDFKEMLRDFGNVALCLLPQSQMNLWEPFECLCVQFEGSC